MSLAENLKGFLHKMANQLPDNATWDNVMEKIRFRQAVEKGIHAADRKEFVSPKKIKLTFSRWGSVNIS